MGCRTLIIHGEGTGQVIDGHDPVLAEVLQRTRTDAKKNDLFYKTHHCPHCGTMLAVTVGSFGGVCHALGEPVAEVIVANG